MVKYNIVELTDMDLPRLQTIATDLGLTDIKGVEKQALIYQILDRQAESVAGMQKEKEAQKSEQKRRGPGRPPKNKSAESAAEASAAEKEPKADTAEKAESKPAKRRPGRPKKNKAAEPTEAAPKAETKEEAEALTGRPVWLDRDYLSDEEAEEFFELQHYVGYELYDASSDASIGVIEEIDDSTLNTLLRVRTHSDEELVLPISEELVNRLDIAEHRLYLHIPAGLLEL